MALFGMIEVSLQPSGKPALGATRDYIFTMISLAYLVELIFIDSKFAICIYKHAYGGIYFSCMSQLRYIKASNNKDTITLMHRYVNYNGK